MKFWIPKWTYFSFSWLLLLSGCLTPCEQLANKICECAGKDNASAKEECLRLTKGRQQSPSFAAAVNQDKCSEVLNNKECACTQLSASACGMTREE